jgi:hypothetical protein
LVATSFLRQYDLFYEYHVVFRLGLDGVLSTDVLVTFPLVILIIMILAYDSVVHITQSGPIFIPFCVYIA